MVRLEDLNMFLRSAALGSFSAAAREVDLLPGQVSAAIKRLESDLQIRLFARSTRSLRLTAEGEQYLPFAREALEALQAGSDLVMQKRAGISGVLQVSASSDLGRNVLLPCLSEFRRRHPDLTLRLFVSDLVSDLYREPVDVAIRYGRLEESDMVALPLVPENRRVLVASPDYLERHGRPESLQALARHACLVFMLKGRAYDKWAFTEGSKRRVLQISGPLVSDDADIVRRWAVSGEGIAYRSWIDVRADVLAGRLEVLLPECLGEAFPLHMVCAHRKQFSRAVRELHASLQRYFMGVSGELAPAGLADVVPEPAGDAGSTGSSMLRRA